MPRSSSPYTSQISFGPGPLPPAIKAIVIANVAVFFAQTILGISTGRDVLASVFGLHPYAVTTGLWAWQLATYMFLHGGIAHILFNMLGLWMFGTELERGWGTRAFLKFYFLTGIGAGVITVLIALLPFGFADDLYRSNVIGASGAIYGVLLAYGLAFPDRPIYMYLVFPIPAKYFVAIMGALAFYSSLGPSGGIASATHLGGLLVGYILLRGGRIDPRAEIRYRFTKWKINRAKKKFDVYSGNRRPDEWNRRVH